MRASEAGTGRNGGAGMKMEQRTARLEIANLALQSFLPAVSLYSGDNGLRMVWPGFRPNDFSARLRNQGDLTMYGYRQRPCGGTGMQALAQLIRYVRDLPRFPLLTWEYWASDKVQCARPATVEILRASDYGAKTDCVLCGSTEWKRGIDWWSLDGLTGPCCQFGSCCASSRHAAK